MARHTTASSQGGTENLTTKNKKWTDHLLTSPLLWGGLLTLGFYNLIPRVPVYRGLLVRYFCSHPLEYATAALFFMGVAILALKALRLSPEKAAFKNCYLLEQILKQHNSAHHEKIARIEAGMEGLSKQFQTTLLAQRVRDAAIYLRGRRTTHGFEEHLKYLAELAGEKLHGSYALVRTITWAVPILGFLGTVIGITIAIANVTPDQLDKSLGEVTSGLAIAFDTTALALMLSLLLVFTSFVVERAEQRVLNHIEDFGIKHLSRLGASDGGSEGPLALAEAQAAQSLLEKTEAVINWQTKLWQDSIESLRQRWSQTLSQQQQSFEQSMRQGMSTTLSDHSEQLAGIRGELLKEFHLSSEDFCARLDQSIKGFSQQVEGWQGQLKASTGAIEHQTDELKVQGSTLLKITQHEENLARTQALLVENLQAVRATETFEETLHSLTAAIHLLTVRAKPEAA